MGKSRRRWRNFYNYLYSRKVHAETNYWLRQHIRDRKNSECEYCKTPLNRKNRSFDHKTPQALGGKRTMANLAACCLDCNRRKADMPYKDWMILIGRENKVQISNGRER